MFPLPIPANLYKIGSAVAIVFGLCIFSFLYGLHAGNLKSKAAIAEYQHKKDKEEMDLLGFNLQVQTKIVTEEKIKEQVIHDVQVQIQHDIPKLPDTESVSGEWVQDYNRSINILPETSSGTSDSSTGNEALSAKEALSGIVDNNASCLEYKNRAEALMEYINKTQSEIDKINKKH